MTRPHRPEGQRPGLEARRYSDRTYHVSDRRPLPDRRDEYEVMEVAPRRRKESVKAGDCPCNSCWLLSDAADDGLGSDLVAFGMGLSTMQLRR
jgi:hypothetical protein